MQKDSFLCKYKENSLVSTKHERVFIFMFQSIDSTVAFNPKRNMQKILTLKYMRGPRGPQKRNGMT